MRIISTIHDYYDGVQREGQDQSLVYVRTPVEKYDLFDCKDLFNPVNSTFNNELFWIQQIIVGFCGKYHLCLKLVHASNVKYCYNIEDCDKFAEAHLSEKNHEIYLRTKQHYSKWGLDRTPYHRRPLRAYHYSLKEKFEKFNENVISDALFVTERCPQFTIRKKDHLYIFTLNHSLKDYDFFRVYDARAAFQEISMFMSNIGNPEKPIPAVSDGDMLEAKGFDIKWSFRKEPNGK